MIHPKTLQSLEFGKITSYLASLCCSSAGRELAASLTPLADVEKAQSAFAIYEQAAVWSASPGADGKTFTLSTFPDTRGVIEAAEKNRALENPGQRLDLDAFWALREMIGIAKKAHESITTARDAAKQWPKLLELAQTAPLPEQLLAALNRCVSDDGLLNDGSSPELARIRTEIRKLHQSCLGKTREFAQKYNMLSCLQDDFMTISSDRYVLPLKTSYKNRMRGIIHDWSQTGETCYFEPAFLVEINNRVQELKHEEREEEQRILGYLADLLDAELPGAKAALNLLASLDILQAKRRMANILDCQCAVFSHEEQGIELLGARHPLLVLSRLNMDSSGKKREGNAGPVRPLDIILRPGERALVITGGNAGGKTVCLKTLGLMAAMSMSGLPAPMQRGSHMPWFDRLDAFIGDEQSLDDNVSTFTAQIDHLAKAWKHLGSSGLCLLDEFGAGTDPAEGAALAQAVLDGLLEKKCFVLAATHFPALKSYALAQKGARAASMLFDPASNRPLFRLAYDQVGSSQALDVAAEHGLPESVLAAARRYLLQDGEDSSAQLKRLNALAAERELELERMRAEEAKAKNILNDKLARLQKERGQILEEIREKSAELMRAYREGRAGVKQSMKKMGGLRAELAASLGQPEKQVLPQPENFTPGQQVLHAAFRKRGIIKDVDERRKRVRLDLNGVSLWADMKDISQSGGTDAGSSSKSLGGVFTPRESAALTVDVRGMRASEAEESVKKFLDRAILAGFSEVEIIHGRGTGALRRELHGFLKSFPGIREFATAPEDRGGDGMTIVKLD